MPSPWESLAQQARELADLADRYATMEATQLAPTGSAATGDLVDPFADLNTRALALVGLVGDCRHSAWQQLRDQGLTFSGIARLWGTLSQQAVSKAFAAADRKSG